jgi:hypothetical protein
MRRWLNAARKSRSAIMVLSPPLLVRPGIRTMAETLDAS